MGYYTAKQQAAMYWARRQRVARQGGAAPPVIPQAETDALVARMGVAPSAARKTLIDNLIVSLKNAGIWADLDILYIIAAHDVGAGQLNWKSASYTLSLVNVPLFVADRGFTLDGTTQCLRTGFIPSTHAINYTRDNASAFVWCRNNLAGASSIAAVGAQGAASVRKLTMLPRRITVDQYFIGLNSDVNAQIGSVTDSTGLTSIDRSTSANITIYKNGINIITGALVSTGIPQVDITLGAINANNTLTGFSTYQIAAFGAGKSLGDTKTSQLYNAINTYLGSIGAA